MDNRIETISNAVFHDVQTDFFILMAVLALIVAVTVVFVIHEIKHDIS